MLLEIFLDDNLKIYTIFREQYGLVSTPMYVCISVCMYVIISCSTFFWAGALRSGSAFSNWSDPDTNKDGRW